MDVCKGVWMGGRGWESFPRFLYASNPNGCNMADVNCMKEADLFTISVLEEENPFADYGKFVFRNMRHSGFNSAAVLKSKKILGVA